MADPKPDIEEKRFIDESEFVAKTPVIFDNPWIDPAIVRPAQPPAQISAPRRSTPPPIPPPEPSEDLETDDLLGAYLHGSPAGAKDGTVSVSAEELRRLRAVDAWATKVRVVIDRLRFIPAGMRGFARLLEDVLKGPV